jgi:hypothetical protein
MTEHESIDLAAAHVRFAATCFNAAWTLIEKQSRTPAEDEQMIALNQASLWHWSQRPDCTDRNRAIGFWQASRIRAILGHAHEATRYANLCLSYSGSLSPFHQACAQEALARAALVREDRAALEAHANQMRELLQTIDDPEEREIILADLATLGETGTAQAAASR